MIDRTVRAFFSPSAAADRIRERSGTVMKELAGVPSLAIVTRVFYVMVGALVYIYLVAALVGAERKAKWFRKRKKYTFFNRRGIFGEDINFGYPICWQGVLVFIAIMGPILGVGYWYIFKVAY